MTVVIRPAHATEAQALADLAKETFPLACPPGTQEQDIADFIATKLSVTHFEEFLRSTAAAVFVAAQGNTLLGYTLALGGKAAEPSPEGLIKGSPTWYLSKLYTLPQAHGSGAAHNLVDAAASHARTRGAQSLWLATNVENIRAMKFYRKYGFVQRGEKFVMVGAERHHDYTFELDL